VGVQRPRYASRIRERRGRWCGQFFKLLPGLCRQHGKRVRSLMSAFLLHGTPSAPDSACPVISDYCCT